ncbi:sensor histidine kinase [Polaribacter pacificus]|uniref:histidine kinase n=1 Tax=Polaribacter pacificus TaxID=1775173 RepID=A0A917HX65_9FLAO|nr:ATP-binding protein [Polaribacter pacificus]GGG94057.1 sensor histidine kinase [Polaribacter pacificus]
MLFAYSLFKFSTEISFFLGILLLILIAQFVFSFNKTNKKIAYFFDAIKNNDSTLYFTEAASKTPTKELNAHLNKVNTIIQKIKLKNKAQDQYYKSIIESAEIGVLTVNAQHHILFANQSVKKLLNYDSLTHIQQLKKVDTPLFELLKTLKPFSNKIIELTNERETKLLTLNATHIKLNNESLLLVVATNIKNELDNKEIDSWVKLTKVLTHEIMNSIAPISSITDTLYHRLKEQQTAPSQELFKDTLMGLQVIKEQSKSLQDFVISYRSFSGVSSPEKQVINVTELLQKIHALFSSEQASKKSLFTVDCKDASLQIFADENQISQVLFNLVKNAVESPMGVEAKKIQLSAFSTGQNSVAIKITDNGAGISKDQIEQVFVPFFSTKKEGSGVGLSLSKHIMKMHNGSLTVHSTPNKSTSFTLIF